MLHAALAQWVYKRSSDQRACVFFHCLMLLILHWGVGTRYFVLGHLHKGCQAFTALALQMQRPSGFICLEAHTHSLVSKLCLLLANRYEPWWIASRALVVPYDVRYRGYGWNKAQQLNAQLHVRESTCGLTPHPHFPPWCPRSIPPGGRHRSTHHAVHAGQSRSTAPRKALDMHLLFTQILYASFAGLPSDINMAVNKFGHLYRTLYTQARLDV